MSKVKVEMAWNVDVDGKPTKPDQTVETDPDTARQLIQDGFARPHTPKDAATAGVPDPKKES